MASPLQEDDQNDADKRNGKAHLLEPQKAHPTSELITVAKYCGLCCIV